MADGYWNRQQQQQQLLVQLQKQQQLHQLQQQQQQQLQQQSLAPSASAASLLSKRPRSDYEFNPSGLPFANEMQNYAPQDDRAGLVAVKDTKAIGSAYDRYLQTAQLPSGEVSGYGVASLGRVSAAAMHPLSVPDLGMSRGAATGLDLAPNGRAAFDGPVPIDRIGRPGREALPLPPDATSTLYVEGLPPNCTKREVAHIFRPFVGYKEVRLVSKESKHRGGDPLILCFVDFSSPAHAASALSALQGYKMDEHDRDSKYLRLEFSKYPGPRSGPAHRGRR